MSWRSPRGLFITGTDTGVGKTLVAAGIVSALRERGIDVGGMKPVECLACDAADSDASFLSRAAGAADPPELVCPYRFDAEAAPAAAATLAGREVSLERILESFTALAARHEFLVVEGAGGFLVPLNDHEFMADLAREMGLPVLIVARADLGTLNHTLLTVEAARVRGIPLRGIVINGYREGSEDLAQRTNPDLLQALAHVPVLGILPRLEAPEEGPALLSQLAELVRSRLDLSVLTGVS